MSTEIQVNTIKCGQFTICGQSIAGTRTCIAIPELGICFDAGFLPDIAIRQPIVLVSHGHADHIGSLVEHAFGRRLRKMPNPTYVMPAECVKGFQTTYAALKCLNRNADPTKAHEWLTHQYRICVPSLSSMKTTSTPTSLSTSTSSTPTPTIWPSNTINAINAILPFDGHKIIKNLIVDIKTTVHRVPSHGYIISRQNAKLNNKYKDLKGPEIAALRKSGTPVTELVVEPLIAYTGDTTIDGLVNNFEFLTCPILITECSFCGETDTLVSLNSFDPKAAHKVVCEEPHDCKTSLDKVENENDNTSLATCKGHIHEQQLIKHASKFKNHTIILTHFSAQYSKQDLLGAQNRLQKAFTRNSIVISIVIFDSRLL